MSRRTALGLGGAATALTLLGRQTTSSSAAGRSHRWETTSNGGESPGFVAPFVFNVVGVLWDGPATSVEVRTGTLDGWSEWMPLHAQDGHGRDGIATSWKASEPLALSGSDRIQYRFEPLSQPMQVACELIDTSAGPRTASLGLVTKRVISRWEWGCDESLRYDSNGDEIWPVEYRTVDHIILHHTVSDNDDTDPGATIRGIYYYHCVTLGWGDIGYNLLVDSKGNVFEGRWGGIGSIAAHAQGYNAGSAGISFLGTFNSRYINYAAEVGAAQVIAANFSYLDPFGRGQLGAVSNLSNICGHRDVLSTECPGAFGYNQLGNIRDSVARLINEARNQAQITNITVSGNPNAGGKIRVDVEVWNNSSSTIQTQGPDPGFTYNQSNDSGTVGHPGQFDRWRVGVDQIDDITGRTYPYRWGFGKSLAPGERTIVTGYVNLISGANTQWWAGLIQEAVAYRIDFFGASKPGSTIPATSTPVPLTPTPTRAPIGPQNYKMSVPGAPVAELSGGSFQVYRR